MDNELREHRANALLENPLFQEAFDVLKEDLMNRWSNSGSADLQARESIWLAMRLLDRIHGHNLIEELKNGGKARSPAST